jgi:3-oxoacyl-[acyl-carrier-protein] synthase-3
MPLNQNVLDERLHFGRLDGSGLYRFGVKTMAAVASEALRRAGVKLEDIDLFIPHQSNARLIEQVSRGLKIPEDKVFVNIHRYANTSAAALPLAMCDAVDAGRLKPGDHVLFATYGAGLTSAGAVVQWAVPTPVKPLPRWHRTWHAFRGAVARVRSAWLRLVHRVDHRLGAGGK